MNQKNSLGLDNCFKDLKNPIDLFEDWFNEAKNMEIKDPNAFSLATADNNGVPSVRILLLKNYKKGGFVFYTNLESKKSRELNNNPKASMCFYWKSLMRQIRITGKILKVSDQEADDYYNSRSYESKIGAWASKQSSILKNMDELYKSIEDYKNKFPDSSNVPRPKNWSGWNLNPYEIEFWLQGKNRIHQRLKYLKKDNENWERSILSP